MTVLERVALSEIATSVDYGVTASATEQPLGPKFLRITDIQNGSVDWHRVPWCECDNGTAAGGRLKQGDIVFARTGATTGKSFLICDCPSNAVFASYLIRVRLGDRADSRYVSHYFHTPDYWAQITASARGVAQPGVNASTLKTLKIPLPSIADQRRIADVLDRAEALRAKRRAALAQLDSLTQSIFLDLFGDTAANPRGFQIRRIADVVSRLTNGFVGPTREIYQDAGVPYLLARHVKGNRLNFDGKTFVSESFNRKNAKSILKTGDVLLVQSGHVGASAVVPPEHEGHNCHAMIVVTPRPEMLLGHYLSHLFASPVMQRSFGGIQTGITLAHLNCRDVRELKIPLPPLDLQHDFVRCVAAVEKLETVHRASLAGLETLFNVLQHRAFRGEL